MKNTESTKSTDLVVGYIGSVLILLFASLVLMAQPAHGQSESEGPSISAFEGENEKNLYQAGITFNTDRAGQDLSVATGNRSYGIGGYFGVNVPNAPIYIGADLNLQMYGSESTTVPFSQTVGPLVELEVSTGNFIFRPMGSIRYQNAGGGFRPYGEVLAGINYAFTQTDVSDEGFGTDRMLAVTQNQSSASIAYGVGVGADLVFASNGDASKTAALTVGVQYLRGGSLETVVPGQIRDENRNGRIESGELGEVRVPSSNAITAKIGITVQF